MNEYEQTFHGRTDDCHYDAYVRPDNGNTPIFPGSSKGTKGRGWLLTSQVWFYSLLESSCELPPSPSPTLNG